MLLTVRDSSSAIAVRRAHNSSGRTTWIRGDLGFPLDEVCRVGTARLPRWAQLPKSVQRWSRIVSMTMLMSPVLPRSAPCLNPPRRERAERRRAAALRAKKLRSRARPKPTHRKTAPQKQPRLPVVALKAVVADVEALKTVTCWFQPSSALTYSPICTMFCSGRNMVPFKKVAGRRRPTMPSCAKCFAWMPEAWKMLQLSASMTRISNKPPKALQNHSFLTPSNGSTTVKDEPFD